MIRTQVYLTEWEHQKIGVLSQDLGLSQSALIREAIDQFIHKKTEASKEHQTILKEARGLWANREDLPDFGALREEWDRE